MPSPSRSFSPPPGGCHLSEQPHNAYQKQGKGVIYIQPTEDHNLPLSEVNFKRLRRMADLSIDPTEQEEWEKEPPLTDLTTDYIYEGAQAFFPHYSYHSDGRYILYAGKIIRNPPGAPPVDIATFQVFGDFAADKNSLYYEGKRTDDNDDENSVDMKTLRKVSLGSRWRPDWLGFILRDRRFLYVNGHRLADPDSFTVLAQKILGSTRKFFLRRLTRASRILLARGTCWREPVQKSCSMGSDWTPTRIPFL